MEKDRLPDPFEDIDQHVMHHTVAEIRREDFSEFWALDHETDRTRGMVGAPGNMPGGRVDERAGCSTTVEGSCIVTVNDEMFAVFRGRPST